MQKIQSSNNLKEIFDVDLSKNSLMVDNSVYLAPDEKLTVRMIGDPNPNYLSPYDQALKKKLRTERAKSYQESKTIVSENDHYANG